MMIEKKSVLVLTTSFPVHGGVTAGVHVLEKCKQLIQYGWNVEVIAPSHHKGKKNEIIDGIQVRRFSYFIPEKLQKLAYGSGIPVNLKQSCLAKIQLPFFMISFLFSGIIRGKKCDVLHAHWFPAGVVGMIVKKIFKKKMVLMMHHPHKSNFLYRAVLKNTDFLFTNSSYVLNKMDRIYATKRKEILPVPINYNYFTPNANKKFVRNKRNIPENYVFIFSAGRFIDLKGFEYLIQAIKILVFDKYHHDICLKIAGQGPNACKYQKLIERYGLENFVELIGYIPNSDIYYYYNEADIFVIPSIIDKHGETEGFGVVSLEANACETPVVASKIGGIVDVIEDGKNGYFAEQKNSYDLAEKLELLINDKNRRIKMGKIGRKIVMHKFNWNSVVKQIIDAYNTIL